MADLAITATQVLMVGTLFTENHLAAAGVTITAGDVLYIDGSDEWQLAACDLTATEADATHVATNGASPGQTATGVLLQRDVVIDLGAAAAAVAGTLYVLSDTPGNHMPAADLASTNFSTFLGIGVGADLVKYNVTPSGAQVP